MCKPAADIICDNTASVTLVQLPEIADLTVLSLLLTPIDFNIFLKLIYSISRFDTVSAT